MSLPTTFPGPRRVLDWFQKHVPNPILALMAVDGSSRTRVNTACRESSSVLETKGRFALTMPCTESYRRLYDHLSDRAVPREQLTRTGAGLPVASTTDKPLP